MFDLIDLTLRCYRKSTAKVTCRWCWCATDVPCAYYNYMTCADVLALVDDMPCWCTTWHWWYANDVPLTYLRSLKWCAPNVHALVEADVLTDVTRSVNDVWRTCHWSWCVLTCHSLFDCMLLRCAYLRLLMLACASGRHTLVQSGMPLTCLHLLVPVCLRLLWCWC